MAHLTGCPYCIDVHIQKFKSLGETRTKYLKRVCCRSSPLPCNEFLDHYRRQSVGLSRNCSRQPI
ncbi:carboxymuconolactone decarboxylase family protein [Paenibacillus sambharensis]|uniref:carboxymuconolactone decarboxylase family protein n=1 Tax=Paenibacillus sambharensis TaxID=1803190 RepID=UPI001FE27CB7